MNSDSEETKIKEHMALCIIIALIFLMLFLLWATGIFRLGHRFSDTYEVSSWLGSSGGTIVFGWLAYQEYKQLKELKGKNRVKV